MNYIKKRSGASSRDMSAHCAGAGGLTQEEMAERLRITGRAYSDLERGIYCFSAVALVFLLLMLEEHEIKELLSSLRKEIAKVEDREVA